MAPHPHPIVPEKPPSLYKATINISPWAHFTVDSDPSEHTTPTTITLSPGPHTFHFSNPELHADKTLTLDMPDHDFKWAAGKLQD